MYDIKYKCKDFHRHFVHVVSRRTLPEAIAAACRLTDSGLIHELQVELEGASEPLMIWKPSGRTNTFGALIPFMFWNERGQTVVKLAIWDRSVTNVKWMDDPVLIGEVRMPTVDLTFETWILSSVRSTQIAFALMQHYWAQVTPVLGEEP